MKDAIHIVGGTGRMGSLLAQFLSDNGFSVTVSGKKLQHNELKNAHFVFLSVPISESANVIKKVASDVPETHALIDLSSVMTPSQKAFQSIKQPHASVHFLFGPDATSLESQTIVVEKKFPKSLNTLLRLFEKKGAKIIFMSSEEHDKAMAELQNMTHFINLALARTLEGSTALKNGLITPVFLAQLSAMTRVVNQPAELLSELQKNNPFGKAKINEFLENAELLHKDIQDTQMKKLIAAIEKIEEKFQPKKVKKEKKIQNERFKPQKGVSAGYLGPAGTHSYYAAQLIGFKSLHAYESIRDVFENTANKTVDFGIVPAQNTIEGAVRETFDLLAQGKTKTVAGVYLPIHHDLISIAHNKKDITDIYSHTQALSQCKKYISSEFPHADLHGTASTLSAIKQNMANKQAAFVVPSGSSLIYRLHILSKNIEDRENNTTRFFVITQKERNVSIVAPKTLLFLSVYNRVGVLRDILTVFANENINLSNIESRPSHDKSWDYHFFVELDMPQTDKRLLEALNILRQYCPQIKILGGIN